MPRYLNRSLRVFLDVGVMSAAYWLAWLLRFEFNIPAVARSVALLTWPCVIALHFVALVGFGIPRMSWRYVDLRDTRRMFLAVLTSSSAVALLRVVQLVPVTSNMIPFSVIAIDFILAFFAIVSVRAAWRVHNEGQDRKKRSVDVDLRRVLLIGAGEAGVIVAREIANRPDLGLHAVGFLDDDPLKQSTSIGGLPVLGKTGDVRVVADRLSVERVLITIANAPGDDIRRITELCRDAQLDTKIIPGIYEIVGNRVNLSRVREVAIEDLLGREPVKLDEEIVGSSLRSRVVLVTGAGGSIGSELCRQICRFGPERLVLVERYENALFEIHRELASAFPHVPIEPRIADVTDADRMSHVFSSTRPAIVFHAAAHKHVPMMEWNPGEAVKNNVGGTKLMAHLSDAHEVERFVLVSTDKAVNPTSVMGATKRIAEIYLQAFSQRSQTRFVTVRFGNVLGSAGSVIPIFRQQIAAGGPVLVTHPEMRRYFMTIPEASQLVLQAGAMGVGGEIFILDMGEPVKIVDLARDLITLSGLRPDDDIEIKFNGIRPGENLFEELSTSDEQATKTTHSKVFIGKIQPQEWKAVDEGISALLLLATCPEMERIRAALRGLVPEYAASYPKSKKTSPSGEPAVSENAARSGSAPAIRN